MLARVLCFAPVDIDVLNELGVAVWRQGRAAEAEAIYLRACRLKPDDFRILAQPGARPRRNWAGPARRSTDCRALQLQPDSFDAQMALGIRLSGQGQFDEAMEWLCWCG